MEKTHSLSLIGTNGNNGARLPEITPDGTTLTFPNGKQAVLSISADGRDWTATVQMGGRAIAVVNIEHNVAIIGRDVIDKEATGRDLVSRDQFMVTLNERTRAVSIANIGRNNAAIIRPIDPDAHVPNYVKNLSGHMVDEEGRTVSGAGAVVIDRNAGTLTLRNGVHFQDLNGHRNPNQRFAVTDDIIALEAKGGPQPGNVQTLSAEERLLQGINTTFGGVPTTNRNGETAISNAVGRVMVTIDPQTGGARLELPGTDTIPLGGLFGVGERDVIIDADIVHALQAQDVGAINARRAGGLPLSRPTTEEDKVESRAAPRHLYSPPGTLAPSPEQVNAFVNALAATQESTLVTNIAPVNNTHTIIRGKNLGPLAKRLNFYFEPDAGIEASPTGEELIARNELLKFVYIMERDRQALSGHVQENGSDKGVSLQRVTGNPKTGEESLHVHGDGGRISFELNPAKVAVRDTADALHLAGGSYATQLHAEEGHAQLTVHPEVMRNVRELPFYPKRAKAFDEGMAEIGRGLAERKANAARFLPGDGAKEDVGFRRQMGGIFGNAHNIERAPTMPSFPLVGQVNKGQDHAGPGRHR